MSKLVKTLPKGWRKINTVLSAADCTKLFAITGDPDFMIVDVSSIIIKGLPITMEGVPGILSVNALTAFCIGECPEGTILKYIKDDDLHFGIVVQHEDTRGVFFALADHTYINTESYRQGEQQQVRTSFVLVGENNVLHNGKGFIAEIGSCNIAEKATAEENEVTDASSLIIKEAGVPVSQTNPEPIAPTAAPIPEAVSETIRVFWEEYNKD